MTKRSLASRIKKAVSAAALFSALSTSSPAAPASAPGYKPPTNKVYAPSNNTPSSRYGGSRVNYSLPQLPSPLTQTNADFYLRPEKEFEFYRNTYIQLAEDGVIDIKDTRTLEHVLRTTIEEIDSKVKLQKINVVDYIHQAETSQAVNDYFEYLRREKKGCLEMHEHLKLYEEWKNSDAVKGKFLHYGTGIAFRISNANEGNTEDSFCEFSYPLFLANGEQARGLPAIFKEDPLYKQSIRGGYLAAPRVTHPEEEILPETKINYYEGLALGIILPLITAGVRRIRRNKEEPLREDNLYDSVVGMCLLNAGLGYLILDSIHPLIYPTRIIAPFIYEAVQLSKHFSRRQDALPSPQEQARNQSQLEVIAADSERATEQVMPNPSPTPTPIIKKEYTEDELYHIFQSASQSNDEKTLDFVYKQALSTHPGLRFRLPPRLELPENSSEQQSGSSS